MPEANEEGKYPLEEPALDALEKALADADKAGKDKDTKIQDLEKQLADQKTAIEAKDARIKELEAMPAAKTQEVIDNGTKAPEAEETPQEQMYAAFARARKMMNGEA